MKRLSLLLIPVILGMMLVTAFGMPGELEVEIRAGSETIRVHTRAENVRQMLDEKQLILAGEDTVSPSLETELEEGMIITIRSAMPVWLESDGDKVRLLTTELTVAQLLEAAEVEMGRYDRVEPSPMSLLTPEMKIRITRVEKEYYRETHPIPVQEITRYVNHLERGETRLVEEGRPGSVMMTMARVTLDGEPADDLIVSRQVVRDPEPRILEKGHDRLVMTGDGRVLRYTHVYDMTATAYDAGYQSTGKNPGDPYYGITRSGTRVRPGVVAVDPRVVPLGSTLYVESMGRSPSYGISHAEDTGGAIKGNRIDLYYESRAEALRFGRQPVRVYVLEEVPEFE